MPISLETQILPDALYDAHQAARWLSFHPETIRRLIREGRIAAVRLGPKLRVRGRDLLAIIEQGLPAAT
ncbi:MAG: helix-turn-helix domain-containing protein [Verrucomicrobiia bacterium]